jgi:hypothetical protein
MFFAEWNHRAFADGNRRLKFGGNKIRKCAVEWNMQGNIDEEWLQG